MKLLSSTVAEPASFIDEYELSGTVPAGGFQESMNERI